MDPPDFADVDRNAKRLSLASFTKEERRLTLDFTGSRSLRTRNQLGYSCCRSLTLGVCRWLAWGCLPMSMTLGA